MFNIIEVLVLVNIINIAKGESSLVAFKKVNSIEIPITSTLIVKNGANLTISCKVVDFNNTEYFDNRIVWSKKTNDSRFQPNEALKWSVNKILSKKETSELIFKPVTLQDEGVYLCSSAKHNLSKTVPIIVRSEDRRRKRGQFAFAKQTSTDIPILNVPDPLREILAKILGLPKDKNDATIIADNSNMGAHSWLGKSGYNFETLKEGADSWTGGTRTNLNHGTSNLETSWPSHSYEAAITKLTSENSIENDSSLDNLYKQIEHHYPNAANDINNTKTTKSEYGVLYFMAAIGGLLLFSGIMCMCIRNNPNLRMRFEGRTDFIPPPSSHVPNAGQEVMHIITIDQLTGDVATPENTLNRELDLPPSYATTVRNSMYQVKNDDLPPSYDEAVANMSLTASFYFYYRPTNITANHSANTSSNVVLDTPRSFARFMPSFLVRR